MSIKLQLPQLTDLRPRLTVIGVGGAGCNAINNMAAYAYYKGGKLPEAIASAERYTARPSCGRPASCSS